MEEEGVVGISTCSLEGEVAAEELELANIGIVTLLPIILRNISSFDFVISSFDFATLSFDFEMLSFDVAMLSFDFITGASELD